MKKLKNYLSFGILGLLFLYCPPCPPKQDCVSFNNEKAEVKLIQKDYKIVDGDHWLFSFGTKKDEAEKSLKIIKYYKMNKSCFVGRPDPSFEYLLVNDNPPAGQYSGEDCIPFDPSTAEVKEFSTTDYRIVDGTQSMYAFGDKKNEANHALQIIKYFKMNQSCFVGRPDSSFNYLRK